MTSIQLDSGGGAGGGGGGGATNLGYTAAAGNGFVTSSTGTSATVPAVDATNAGLMIPAQRAALADMITAPAQGDLVYYNGTAWVKLPAGTSGQFLKTNGAGANPAWAAGGGGSGVPPASDWQALTALTGANLAVDDLFPVVDVSAAAVKTMRADELYNGIRPSNAFARLGIGAWHVSDMIGVTPNGAGWPIINRLMSVPYRMDRIPTISALAINVTAAAAAGNVIRLALYDADPVTALPTTCLEQGTVAADTTGVKTLTFAANRTPKYGFFYVFAGPQGAGATGSAHLTGPVAPSLQYDRDVAASWGGYSGASPFLYISSSTALTDNPSCSIDTNGGRTPYVGARFV